MFTIFSVTARLSVRVIRVRIEKPIGKWGEGGGASYPDGHFVVGVVDGLASIGVSTKPSAHSELQPNKEVEIMLSSLVEGIKAA